MALSKECKGRLPTNGERPDGSPPMSQQLSSYQLNAALVNSALSHWDLPLTEPAAQRVSSRDHAPYELGCTCLELPPYTSVNTSKLF